MIHVANWFVRFWSHFNTSFSLALEDHLTQSLFIVYKNAPSFLHILKTFSVNSSSRETSSKTTWMKSKISILRLEKSSSFKTSSIWFLCLEIFAKLFVLKNQNVCWNENVKDERNLKKVIDCDNDLIRSRTSYSLIHIFWSFFWATTVCNKSAMSLMSIWLEK